MVEKTGQEEQRPERCLGALPAAQVFTQKDNSKAFNPPLYNTTLSICHNICTNTILPISSKGYTSA